MLFFECGIVGLDPSDKLGAVSCSGAAEIYSRALTHFRVFARAEKRPRTSYIGRNSFCRVIYITLSGDLNNNPIRSGVDGRRASQVYVSPPCLLVGTKQICEIAFPRARGARGVGMGIQGGNRNGIRTRQFVQCAGIMTPDK